MIVINSDNAIDVKEPVGSGNPTLTIEHGDGLVDFEGSIEIEVNEDEGKKQIKIKREK